MAALPHHSTPRLRFLSGRRPLLCVLLAALLFGDFAALPPLQAQKAADLPVVRRLQAGIIHNFIRFTTWPDAALPDQAPLRIGIYDDGHSAELLRKELDSLTAAGRPLRAQLLQPDDPLEGFHVVVLLRKAPLSTAALMAKLSGLPVLSIGEVEGFTTEGGMIRLFLRNDTFHFSLNPRAAREAGLTLSSQLGALAEPGTP